MSTSAIKLLLNFALIAALLALGAGVTWLAVRDTTPPAAAPQPSRPRTPPAAQAEMFGGPLDANGDWLMYRGEPALRGVAAGTISDAPRLAWRYRAGDRVDSSTVIGFGKVFFGCNDGLVYAIDLATGRKAWTFATAGAIKAPPTLSGDGMLYVGSNDGNFYAINAADGSRRWSRRIVGFLAAAANIVPVGDGMPQRVIVCNLYDHMHCLNAADGNELWEFNTHSEMLGPPTVDDRKIIFGCCDGKLRTLSAADGNELTAIDANSSIAVSAAVSGTRAYVDDFDKSLLCIDLAAGRVAWSFTMGVEPFISCAAVAEDRVVLGARDKMVHCLSLDGNELWRFKGEGSFDSSPVICGRRVVIGCDDGKLYMLDLDTGAPVWSHALGVPISTTPAVAGGKIAVCTDDGWLYVFDARPQAERK